MLVDFFLFFFLMKLLCSIFFPSISPVEHLVFCSYICLYIGHEGGKGGEEGGEGGEGGAKGGSGGAGVGRDGGDGKEERAEEEKEEKATLCTVFGSSRSN